MAQSTLSPSDGKPRNPLPPGDPKAPAAPGYTLVRRIGAGAYGEVWLGYDMLGVWRAVKIVRRAAFESQEPYEREFKGLAAYVPVSEERPSLMRIFPAQRKDDEGYFYYGMELADPVKRAPASREAKDSQPSTGATDGRQGGDWSWADYTPRTLKSELASGQPLPLAECLTIAREVATALGHLHDRGRVHRDVKPSNIVFLRGEAKLADIGLVAKMEQTLSLSRVGAPLYMPEEGAGTPPGDLYALGKVLYQMATGYGLERFRELPSRDEAGDRHRGILELNRVILKACATEPKQRYQTAAAMITELKLLEEGSSLRARRWLRLALLGLTALVVLLFAALVVQRGWNRARSAQRERELLLREAQAQARQLQLLDSIQRAPRLTAPGRSWFDGVWSNATEAAKIRATDEVKNMVAATFAGLDARSITNVPGWCASSVAFDPDGRRLLVGGHSSRGVTNGAVLWDLESGRRQTSVWARPGPVTFDASGRALQLTLHEDRRSGLVWDVAGERSILKFEFESRLAPARPENAPEPVLAISPDGALVAAAASFTEGETNRTFLEVWETAGGKRLWQVGQPVSALAFSPGGGWLAAGDEAGVTTIWRLPARGRVTQLRAARASRIESLAFHRDPFSGPDSPTNENWILAVGEKGGNVTVWDVTKRIPRHFYSGHSWGVFALAFNPSGTMLAAGGRNWVHLWSVASGRLLLRLTCSDSINGLCFSADGRRLAVGGQYLFNPGNLHVWGLEPGRGIYSLHGLHSPIATDKIRFSPDGSMVAALAQNWQLGVWDLSTYEPRLLVNAPQGIYADNAGLAFSADSRRFAFATASGARLWDLKTKVLAHEPWVLPPGLQENLAFHESGRLLLFRVETVDATRWPYIDAEPKPHPRVCRVRDLLRSGTAWTNVLAEITNFNLRVFHAAMTPDGHRVVVNGTSDWRGFGTNEYMGFDTLSGQQVWSLPSQGSGSFRLDPLGRFTVLWTNNANALVEVDSGRILKTAKDGWGLLGPDAKSWLAGREPGQPGVSVMVEGRKLPLVALGIDVSGGGEFVFSPDGRMVAWGGDDGTVFVCRLEEVRQRLAGIGLGW